MKYCSKCKETKALDQFFKRCDRPGQYLSQCKPCRALVRLDPEVKKYMQCRYLKNHEANKAYRRQHVRNNPKLYRAIEKRYLSARKRATPPWITAEQKKQMASLKQRAKRLSSELGARMEIDHIIPLQGKIASGLHVPWNLRIVTSTENKIKGRSV